MTSSTTCTTAKLPVYIGYRCSGCGQVQIYTYKLKVTDATTHRGIADRKTHEAMRTASKAGALFSMQMKIRDQQAALQSRDFGKAGLPSNRCKNCRNTEPWMISGYQKLLWAALACMAAGVLMLLVAYLIARKTGPTDLSVALLRFSGVFELSWPALLILRWYLRKNVKTRVKDDRPIDERSLPLVCYDKSDFLLGAAQRFGNDADTLKSIMDVT